MSDFQGLSAAVTAPDGAVLGEAEIWRTLEQGLGDAFSNKRVLALIPDHTRTIPLPTLFPMVVDILAGAARLDFMVALGTHPALSEGQLARLVGVTPEARATTYRHVGLFNHEWSSRGALAQVATITGEQVKQFAGALWHPSLGGDVPVRINRRILDYDHILILGPTFPHEVAGFSGGAKYLFPGISGPEMIDVTHWLGALAGVRATIGVKETPVRAMIHAAAETIPVPVTLASMVVMPKGLAGLYVGDLERAWEAAADLSSQRHIRWFDRPFQRVLSWAPPMYDELWTAAKAMYKLEPVVADGGELIIYAPHLDVVSHVHGHHIYQIGYHVLDYFLAQWERFHEVPLGVLAHSTHVRGAGRFVEGVEMPRIQVTLASQLSAEACARLALGYADPAKIDPERWRGREDERILFVPKAGEMLYRLRLEEND